MNVVLNVEGMMCPHCEARVNKAVSSMAGVESAVADHNTNTVTVTVSKDITEDEFKAVIDACGYDFKGMTK
ncbi:MAG: heavy-metal-associated domain-containing protein [Clostridia bacterium]|nr:heavy-metal-associated domain-containing protein [Clostridia bacterium]